METKIETAVKGHQGTKKLIILASILIAIFVIIFVLKFFSQEEILTLDELHQKNLNDELAETQGYLYQGYSFVYFDGLWYTRIQDQKNLYEVPLHFGPKQVEDIIPSGTLSQSFDQGSDVYITFNPISSNMQYIALATGELTQNMVTAIKRRPIGACDRNETEACKNRPIITCQNTQKPVIYLQQEPGPAIELNQNCIILKGLGYDLVKAVDKFLYQWYGIMQ